MKLDLVEIRKLSPSSLWDLGVLSELIPSLQCMIAVRIGGGWSVLYYTRMLVQYSQELRTKTQKNLAVRIKAWVMQCPARIEHVRSIIGEAAIKRWRKNRLADYALSKYFGDWRRKFPNGFAGHQPKQDLKFTRPQNIRPYNWKLFSLTRICNVERFLYGQAQLKYETNEMRAAYYKLWNIDILDDIKSAQPRAKRSFKPVKFIPDELMPEAATGGINDNDDDEVKVTITPPSITRHLPIYPSIGNAVTASCREPPSTNI